MSKRLFAALLAFQALTTACNQKGGGDQAAGSIPVGGTNEPGTIDPGGTGTATALEFSTFAVTDLFTEETAENTCVTFTVKALKDGAVSTDVGIVLSVQADSATMTEKGNLTPESGVTNAAGELASTYCSGKSEGKVTILAKAGSIVANSAKLTVGKKPVFAFTYVRADIDPLLLPSDGEEDEAALYLNVIDSGPQDCTNLYFKLTKSESPVAAESIAFTTQVDYPKGAKLAKREDAGETAIDAKTGKKYATYTAISSGAGEFAVPVCAGVSLGSILLSATYVDDEEKSYTVHSPVIRITSGLTNYINFSLTFDPGNARTLKAYYNTNSSYDLPFAVQLGARFDGRAIVDYPVSIATEVGQVTIDNGGLADLATGTVKAKLHALHLIDNYPYAMQVYNNFPLAQTRCDPEALQAYAVANALTDIKYSDLRKNWRSTMTYMIRGQEHYHDANRNGVYDAGGDGFWDKNQNGIFDTGDVLTFDAGGDSLFNRDGEWFIDLPTPFVDVNEDRAYTENLDILIGDEYADPNGERDSDALLWKDEVFPISMGPSGYGMQRQRIKAVGDNSPDPTVTVRGTTGTIFGIDPNIDGTDLFGGAVDTDLAVYTWASYIHDLCGNVLTGGTKLKLVFTEGRAPLFGPRTPTGHIYTQPDDFFREPTRHILQADGGPEAKINFNATDHPTAAQSYPVFGNIEIPPCTNSCTGAVQVNPGVACDGWAGHVALMLEEAELDQHSDGVGPMVALNFTAVNACNCIADPDLIQVNGVCKCTNPLESYDGTGCN